MIWLYCILYFVFGAINMHFTSELIDDALETDDIDFLVNKRWKRIIIKLLALFLWPISLAFDLLCLIIFLIIQLITEIIR